MNYATPLLTTIFFFVLSVSVCAESPSEKRFSYLSGQVSTELTTIINSKNEENSFQLFGKWKATYEIFIQEFSSDSLFSMGIPLVTDRLTSDSSYLGYACILDQKNKAQFVLSYYSKFAIGDSSIIENISLLVGTCGKGATFNQGQVIFNYTRTIPKGEAIIIPNNIGYKTSVTYDSLLGYGYTITSQKPHYWYRTMIDILINIEYKEIKFIIASELIDNSHQACILTGNMRIHAGEIVTISHDDSDKYFSFEFLREKEEYELTYDLYDFEEKLTLSTNNRIIFQQTKWQVITLSRLLFLLRLAFCLR